jgi:cytochrome c
MLPVWQSTQDTQRSIDTARKTTVSRPRTTERSTFKRIINQGVIMKTVIMSLVFMALPAWADNALLVKNNCLACHNVNQTVVGPAFKDVANRYRGQADAVDRLAKKIRAGGAGVWGAMPMPAHPQIAEADAKKLAVYILNIK